MIMTDLRRSFVIPALLVVCTVVPFAVRGYAQVQQPAGTDVLPALLQEVKGLRAAMEQMATSNAHAQLLVGRLQLQESRMNSMIRRLDTVRDERAKAQATYDQIQGSLQMLERDQTPNEMPQNDRDNVLGGLKHEVETAKSAVDRWASEESQLTADLTTEQGRWVDINQRLDELERSLKK
jgi:chromosome segregation ATPase